jgi:hypothetical protein
MTPLEQKRIQQRKAAIAANAGVYGDLGAKGVDYWAQDLGHYKQYQQRLAQRRGAGASTPSSDATSTPSAPVDPTQAFLDQIKPLLTRSDQPTITPFDQSGFYNEGDVKALADTEYDPYYAKQRAYQDFQTAEQDKQRQMQEKQSDRDQMEQVNASGGFRSSAYQRDLGEQGTARQSAADLRKKAIQQAYEEQGNTQKAEKAGFVTNRRNEAYQRYLQSIGAVTQ